MKKLFLLFVLLFIPMSILAQVKGKVTDTQKNPLSFVSVYLEKTLTGTTTNDNGGYVLKIQKKGKHTIIFQTLGYQTLKKEINITSFPFELNIELEEENIQLEEVVISTKDNPANAIIRNVIANKDKITDKFSKYTANFYSRGLYKIKEAPEKWLGRSLGDFGGGLDSTRSGIVYLSETISEITYQKSPTKFKEKITASKVSGKDNGPSFNRAEDANINFYENSVELGNDLISPLSSNAFSYYRFKLIGTFYAKNGKLINKIKLLPKRKNDPVFSGSIYIVEDDWAIYGADVTVTGAQVNFPAIDLLSLKQGYNYSEENDSWVLISQIIEFQINFLMWKFDGKFSSAYSNYNFTPKINIGTFSNEVLAFAKEATKKDDVYWREIRPVPLTADEVKDYSIKDSIKLVRKSKKYLDSINKKQNKLNLLSPITGYTFRNSFEKRSLYFNGLLGNSGFNTVQGLNTTLGFNYFKRLNDKGKWWNSGVKANYSFSDKRLRPTFFFTKKWNNISRPQIGVSGGVTTAQFNGREPISGLDNTIISLYLRDNYFKIYEKEFAKITYSEEIKNGIFFSTSLEYANRKPLFNTNNYSFARQSKNAPYTSNNPLDKTDYENAAFTAHKIATLNIGATFVFNQKYLSYPDRKFNMGNEKYPSLTVNYRKNFAASNANLNSDLFTANLKQDISAGNYGDFSYNVKGGLFLKKKDIAFMDNLQANGNQLTFVTVNQLNSFDLLPYYKYFTNDKYAEMHIEHNFRGAILSKIPLLNRLNFHIVAGGKGLFMADKNPYTESAIGLSNIGFGKWRFLRIDYVHSNYGGIKNEGLVFKISMFN
ncbi:MAG: carboxypeptidase-like regulatory domain-containing protein [Polaribacter sp.]|nr:carboxypeptidase-like regulatory domain-containing protein [Polaribacter sp.]